MKLFLISIVSGIISGMGIGGGAILIPSLIFIGSLSQQEAQGINLIAFIPIATVALIIHFKNKSINFELAKPLIITGIVGALIGSTIAVNIPSNTLRRIFAIFLLVIGACEIISSRK